VTAAAHGVAEKATGAPAADEEPFVKPDDPVEVPSDPTPINAGVAVIDLPAPPRTPASSIDIDELAQQVAAVLAEQQPMNQFPRVMPLAEPDDLPSNPMPDAEGGGFLEAIIGCPRGGISGVELDRPPDAAHQIFTFWMGLLSGPSGCPGVKTESDPDERRGDPPRNHHSPGCPFGGVWRAVPGGTPAKATSSDNGCPARMRCLIHRACRSLFPERDLGVDGPKGGKNALHGLDTME